ncbi:S41 family peptidase [Chitinophaga qingshengii]|uniref:PDZ domain-containing protein n=1 Tax=Chitinophaga qingshengii TaxID=1569794 RepID=A0ABR7TGV2_9BACT|nr:S41 family peptidase [Chitinophaga qingshengii]MBC9928736.1 hypothetical protein [Chitinophaga qingshengii]
MHTNLFTSGARVILTGIASVLLWTACRKDNKTSPDNPPKGDTIAAKPASAYEDSLKYLMYQIMQVTYADGGRNAALGLPTYYWYSQVPALNPLDSKYANADSLLSAMKTYAINPATTQPFDHYSFLDRNGVLTNKLMNGISSQAVAATNSGDFGFDYLFARDNEQKLHIFVVYVDKNSPAGQAGIARGWEIVSVNGNSNFSFTQSFLQSLYSAVFNSPSVTLGLKPSTSSAATVTKTLTTATYNINPVVFDTTFIVTDVNHIQKKVGYFSMYTFSSVINSNGQDTYTKTVLDQLFSKFASQGINNLIVDFRYNGGGAVATTQYLCNAIAPSAAVGQVMYTTLYNDKLMAHISDVKLTTTTNFATTTGKLKLDNVFFITSGSTASASELTLNSLKPYMPVQLVGSRTYGKPVGFIDFNISVFDPSHKQVYLADLYAINFETKNAKGEGGYYTGIPVDAAASDFIDASWGDTQNDENLKKIVNYLTTGNYNTSARIAAPELNSNLMKVDLSQKPAHGFNGMVDYERSRLIRAGR